MAKVTTTADSLEIKRAKWAQTLTNEASSDTTSNCADLVCVLVYVFLSLNLAFVHLSSVPVQRYCC